MSIKTIHFERNDIGAHIRKSKSQFIWKFSVDSVLVTVELMCSHFTGKKKIYKDGQVIYEAQKFGTSFQFPFQIGNHMLNIIQHGDHFELRIDNQSFQHLYEQEKTRKHFVFDDGNGNKGHAYEDREDQAQKEDDNNQQNNDEDYGYGNYKRGHPDVNLNWYNSNKQKGQSEPKPSSGKQQQESDDPLWADVKQARDGSRGVPKQDQNDVRKKKYDDYSPKREDAKQEAQKKQQPSTFDFNSFGSEPQLKKGQFQSQQPQQIDNLLDLGDQQQQPKQQAVKTFDDMFSFDNKQQTQAASNQPAGFFDFDFSNTAQKSSSSNSNQSTNFFDTNQQQQQKPQQQEASSGFDFNFSGQSSTQQPKAFDFNSFNQPQQPQQARISPQKNAFDLIDTSSTQPQASLDDLLSNNSAYNQSAGILKPETEDQKRIRELLATGYNQQPPQQQMQQNVNQFQNPQVNKFNSQPLGKENQEKSLVNLDDLIGNKSTTDTVKTQGNFKPMGYQQNSDPFAEAFQGPSMIQQQNQGKSDAFNFVQNEIKQQAIPPYQQNLGGMFQNQPYQQQPQYQSQSQGFFQAPQQQQQQQQQFQSMQQNQAFSNINNNDFFQVNQQQQQMPSQQVKTGNDFDFNFGQSQQPSQNNGNDFFF